MSQQCLPRNVSVKLKWLRNATVVATLVLSIDKEVAKKVVALWGPTRPKLTVQMTCIEF
jgi:hypothetical protein